jgi:predicted metal-dependent phosphoesterase TrpH
MKLDLHIHSKYSYDSFSEPSKIVKMAKRKGLDVISITDHDNMKVYEKPPHKLDIIVVRGMEIKTDMGDVTGLFLNWEIKTRSFFDVVDEIRGQDGIVVLPHPFRRKCEPTELVEYVDLVEVINARSRNLENINAQELCNKFDKRPITGSDAHTYFEIGRVVTEIDGHSNDLGELKKILLNSKRKCYGKETPFYISHGYSFIVSRIKRRVL